jgi:acetoin utilization protein AcuB
MIDGIGGRAPRLLDPVSEIMTAPVIAADPLSTVGRAQGLAERHGLTRLPVAWDDGEIVGIVCVCDLWAAKPHELIIQYMALPVVTVSTRETVMRAAEVMRDNDVGCLPILNEHRRLCGIVTEGDLLRAGAIGIDQLPPACAGCGSRHHVRPAASRASRTTAAFCLRCLGASLPTPTSDSS